MFMHNGIIAGFSKIRRKLLEGLSEAAYDSVQSFHSDSAVSFALFLSFLPDMEAQQPPDVILIALQRALQLIGEKQAEAGLADCREHTSLLNFAVTDGATLIVTCCVSPDDEKPASLYYAEGTTFRCVSLHDSPSICQRWGELPPPGPPHYPRTPANALPLPAALPTAAVGSSVPNCNSRCTVVPTNTHRRTRHPHRYPSLLRQQTTFESNSLAASARKVSEGCAAP